MDALHAKAMSDLHLGSAVSEDEFYDRLSCDWLHAIRAIIRKRHPRQAPEPYGLVRAPQDMEL